MQDSLGLKLVWCHVGLYVDGLDERGRYRVVDDISIGPSFQCELRVGTDRGLVIEVRRCLGDVDRLE